MRRHAARLLDCSRERLTEEFFKILASGKSRLIVGEARKYRLMDILWPGVPPHNGPWDESPLARRLGELDSRIDAGQTISRGRAVAVFYEAAVEVREHVNTIVAIQELLKETALPLVLSNRDTREAAHILQQPPPQTKSKRRRRRRGSGQSSQGQAPSDQRSVAMRLKSESTLSP
jgi:tRNA nucleotidyltransferase/poly(A) polymerase